MVEGEFRIEATAPLRPPQLRPRRSTRQPNKDSFNQRQTTGTQDTDRVVLLAQAERALQITSHADSTSGNS